MTDEVQAPETPPQGAANAFALAASMEGQGTAAPEALTGAGGTPAPVAPVLVDGPAVKGVDAWAAALGLHGISAEIATTLATNCLRDGYAQGENATTDTLADHAAQLTAELDTAKADSDAQSRARSDMQSVLADADKQIDALTADLKAANERIAEMAKAPEPAPHGESMFHRLEDDVILAAEETAYHTSNLIADVSGRKPDDGIDAWRKRTGGLRGVH